MGPGFNVKTVALKIKKTPVIETEENSLKQKNTPIKILFKNVDNQYFENTREASLRNSTCI